MANLTATRKRVEAILEHDKQARNSDDYLYYRICQDVAKENGLPFAKMTAPAFILARKEFGYPPFETVRRARQLVQERRPELAASSGVKEGRSVNEQEYRAFALSGKDVAYDRH